VDVDCFAATIAAASMFSAGDLIAERYRVECVIGRGAMGVVYRVEHVHMRKRFALKVLDGAWARTPGAFARFEREAIAAGTIADPHVAHATDFGRLPDGSCYLVLEYIDGLTLRKALKRGPLKPRRALKIARGIVSAVEAAHSVGIIHRDLKPENIMLLRCDGDPDYVKVLDFGIAAVDSSVVSDQSSEMLTRKGGLLGTPSYMAPEQVTGAPTDARTDLYAIGVILFEMLTGDLPFRGAPISVMHQQVAQEAPPLPPSVLASVGERVAQILCRLLAKDPGARLATARELGSALDEHLTASTSTREALAVRAEWRDILSSLRAWRTALLSKLQARRRGRRAQVAAARPKVAGGRLRVWARRRGREAFRATTIFTKRVWRWLERTRARVGRRHLPLALAAVMTLLLLMTAWHYGGIQHATATAAIPKSPASLASPSGSTHPKVAPSGSSHASSHHPSGATSAPRRQ
jgi:hypothetical protein